MPLLTDEPLIDDSELDDFDWDACLAILIKPARLTWRGNIMTSYHRLMHTTALCVSAVLFQAASWVLGRAVHHKNRINLRSRIFGARAKPMAGYEHLGPMNADEEEFIRNHERLHLVYGQPLTKWIEADLCSDYQEAFDPVHPDYTPYSEK